MSISFTRYVDITSGVAGAGAVRDRELITRIFTSNALVPANSFAEFTSATQVGAFFGTTGAEYLMAAYYFAFISKQNTAPQKLSFASWPQVAANPWAAGDPLLTQSLNALKTITTGHMTMTLGATTASLTAISFSSATTMANIATILQTAIRTNADPTWANATVVFNSTTANFTITGGNSTPTNALVISFAASTPGVSDIAAALGMESVNTVLSNGTVAESLTTALSLSASASNNFATFAFVPNIIAGSPTTYLTATQILEVATWNATVNNSFMFLVPVSAATASAVNANLISLPGNGMTLSPSAAAPLGGVYPELIPGMVLASTDYDGGNNVSQNYMYQVVSNTPASVSDDNTANTMDALRVNYYGQTQTAGQNISFYQRGVLTGVASSPTDMNVYANEIWLKTEMGTAFMGLLLALSQVSANAVGRAQLISTAQAVVNVALVNGVISVGTVLTNTQQLAVTQITNDPRAWYQVQSIGYYLTVSFSSIVTIDGRTEYQADYLLVYKKNDAIRAVIGTHTLI